MALAGPAVADPLVLRDRGQAVTFPLGRASFADAVAAYRVGGPPPSRSQQVPSRALAAPDFATDPAGSVSLGSGGSLVLQFRDNSLVDVDGPDLYIFEIGPDVEAMSVEISQDGQNWISVGRVSGSTCSLDISPYVQKGQRFSWVRLTDDPKQGDRGGSSPGADVDAVGAIGSVFEQPPTPAQEQTRFLAIGDLTIDTLAWQAERMGSQEDLRRAGLDLEGCDKVYQQAVERVAHWHEQVQRLTPRPAPSAQPLRPTAAQEKTKATLAQRIVATQARLQVIQERRPQAISDSAGRLLDAEAADLRRALARDREQLNRVETAPQPTNQTPPPSRDFLNAESELRLATAAHGHALTAYQDSLKAYEAVAQRLEKLGATSPTVTSVITRGYQARLWEPVDVLESLNRDIRSTHATLWRLDQKRRLHSGQLLTLDRQLTAASRNLASSQWQSILSQYGVEVASFGYDLAKGVRKGGVAGALSACAQKAVDLALSGVEYHDSVNTIPKTDATSKLWNIATLNSVGSEAAGGRLVKTLAGDQSELALDQYLTQKKREVWDQLVAQQRKGTWAEGMVNLPDRLKSVERDCLKLEKELASRNWRSMLAKGGLSFYTEQLKDDFKETIKKELAEMIEGAAWQDYMAAEMSYRAEVGMVLKYSGLYWESQDALNHLIALRQNLLRRYNPNASMLIENTARISPEQDLTIEVSLRGADPHHPNSLPMQLFYGNIQAERLSGGRSIFRIPASKLREMLPQAHPLRILVKGR